MSGWPDEIAVEKQLKENGENSPVLIVATEAVMRNAINVLFSEHDIDCIMTGSVIDAMRVLQDNQVIRYVVLDCVDTNMDLEWFLMEVKNSEYQVEIFGSSDSNDPEDFHRYGRVHHLPKFWNIIRLRAAIEQVSLLTV